MTKNINQIRKFQFFDIIEGEEKLLKNKISNDENKIEEKKENQLKIESKISISNISPNQMFAIDGVIFLSGKAIYKLKIDDEKNDEKNEIKNDEKIKEKIVREHLIMKIYNNNIIDEYRIFKPYTYEFLLKTFKENSYFVIIGGDLDEYKINNVDQKFLTTSIKIYDANSFIQNPKTRQSKDRNIEKFKIKQIKLLYNKKTGNFITEAKNLENIESFQNILSFTINDDFTQIAVGLEKGEILLLNTVENKTFLDSLSEKEIKIRKLIKNEKNLHLTNLAFANVLNFNVLYATTAESVFFYKLDNKTFKDELVELNSEEGGGAYSGCIAIKENNLIVGSNIGKYITEYTDFERGASWFFEGKKAFVKYFKNYLMFVTYGDKIASLQVYDIYNKFFVYYKSDFKRISGLCCDQDFIYAFVDDDSPEHNKFIIKLKEKPNKEKFDIFFKKNFFDTAFEYAKSLDYSKNKISEISKLHAEYCYKKGEYDKSIEQYIKTINFLEPAYVIQQFLDKSKLNYLIVYLEALDKDKTFQMRDEEELKDYTTLLLNCYIMQEKVDDLKNFIEKRNISLPTGIIKTAIEVCLDIQKYEIALKFAKQNKLFEEYLNILINKQGKLKEALDFIQPEDKNVEGEIGVFERINYFCEFGEYYLNNKDEKIGDDFFNRVDGFIKENYVKEKRKDFSLLMKIFFGNDKYFKKLFEKILSYKIECDKNMIHRRIELYLDEDDANEKKNILKMLDDERFKDKIDKIYLLMLFKFRDFSEGIMKISEMIELKQELFFNYLEKKDFEKIINSCELYGNDEKEFWGIALEFFLDKKNRKNENEEKNMNKFLCILLDKIITNKIMSSVQVLNMIHKFNPEINVGILRDFMEKSMKNEIEPLNEYEKNFESKKIILENNSNEIQNLKTKSIRITPNKCSSCNMLLSLPAIHFFCHHSYHILCLNANLNDEMKNIECVKCKEKKDSILEEIKNLNDLNEKFEYDEKNYKFNDLYGKDLIKLSEVHNLEFVEEFKKKNNIFNNDEIKVEIERKNEEEKKEIFKDENKNKSNEKEDKKKEAQKRNSVIHKNKKKTDDPLSATPNPTPTPTPDGNQ